MNTITEAACPTAELHLTPAQSEVFHYGKGNTWPRLRTALLQEHKGRGEVVLMDSDGEDLDILTCS